MLKVVDPPPKQVTINYKPRNFRGLRLEVWILRFLSMNEVDREARARRFFSSRTVLKIDSLRRREEQCMACARCPALTIFPSISILAKFILRSFFVLYIVRASLTLAPPFYLP